MVPVILREPPDSAQLDELLETFETLIKLAVDVRREVLAAGGQLHYDCEQLLLQNGSQQEDIWGADWFPVEHIVRFESLINIRPRQSNFGLEIHDPQRRAQVEQVVRKVFEGR